MVKAAATAVFCTSAPLIVGAAGVQQALMIVARMATVRREKRFMLCEYLLIDLAVGITSAPGGNTVIFYNNFPITFCDAEAAEGFEVLFAGDKSPGRILPDGSGEAIPGDD